MRLKLKKYNKTFFILFGFYPFNLALASDVLHYSPSPILILIIFLIIGLMALFLETLTGYHFLFHRKSKSLIPLAIGNILFYPIFIFLLTLDLFSFNYDIICMLLSAVLARTTVYKIFYRQNITIRKSFIFGIILSLFSILTLIIGPIILDHMVDTFSKYFGDYSKF